MDILPPQHLQSDLQNDQPGQLPPDYAITPISRRLFLGGALAIVAGGVLDGCSSPQPSRAIPAETSPAAADQAPSDTSAKPEASTLNETSIAPNPDLIEAIKKTDLYGLDTALIPEVGSAFEVGKDLYARTVLRTLSVASQHAGTNVLTADFAGFFLAQGYVEDIGSFTMGNAKLLAHSPSAGGGSLNKADGSLSESVLTAVGPFQIDALPQPLEAYGGIDNRPGNYTDDRRVNLFKQVTGLPELPVGLEKDAIYNIIMGVSIGVILFEDHGYATDRATLLAVGDEYGTLKDNNPTSPLDERIARFMAVDTAVQKAFTTK